MVTSSVLLVWFGAFVGVAYPPSALTLAVVTWAYTVALVLGLGHVWVELRERADRSF